MESSVTLETVREYAFSLREARLLNQAEESELEVLYLTNEEWNHMRRTWVRDTPGNDPFVSSLELGQLGQRVLFGMPVTIDEEKAAERKATLGW